MLHVVAALLSPLTLPQLSLRELAALLSPSTLPQLSLREVAALISPSRITYKLNNDTFFLSNMPYYKNY